MRKILLFVIILISSSIAQEKPQNSLKVFGYFKNWYQADLLNDKQEFLIKNARLGIKGNVNEYAGFKVLVDFTRLGKFQSTSKIIDSTNVITSASASFSDYLLDAEATIAPSKSLAFTLGQFKVPFSTDNLRSGADIDFVNRPFTTAVAPALRDIGFMVSYKPEIKLPVEIKAGLFNGSGQNKAENDKTLNYSLRGMVHPFESLGLSANYYGGKSMGNDLHMFNFGAEYEISKFSINGEYGQKLNELSTQDVTSNAFFIGAIYDFAFDKSMISHIMPAIRYERYEPNKSLSNDEIEKITAGLSLQFAKISYAQLRANYELYDYKNGNENPDRFIIELQIRY